MKDKCVSCGIETLYERTDHIDFRLGYIEGAGQLCLDCYGTIYVCKSKKEKHKENSEDIYKQNRL